MLVVRSNMGYASHSLPSPVKDTWIRVRNTRNRERGFARVRIVIISILSIKCGRHGETLIVRILYGLHLYVKKNSNPFVVYMDA